MEFRFRACDVDRSRPLVPPPVASAAAKEDELLMKERLRAEIRKEVEAELLAKIRGSEHVESPPVLLLGASSVESPRAVEDGPPALTTSGAKRKQPDDASEKSLEDHLSVKSHKKEVLSDAATSGELVVEEHLSGKSHKKEVLSDAATSGELSAGEGVDNYKPSKLAMRTCDGKTYHVLQMDGYLLCELCNVRTTDRVTMMCHLQGGKHISKVRIQNHDIAAAEAKEKRASLSPDVHNVITTEVICDLCNVRADNEAIMRSHLGGKKHKSKAMAAPAAVDMRAKKDTNEALSLQVEGDASMTKDKDEADSTMADWTDVDTSVVSVPLASTQAKTVDVASTSDTDMSVDETAMMGEDLDAKTGMCQNKCSQYITLKQANDDLFCETTATGEPEMPSVESPQLVEVDPLTLAASGSKRKQTDDALPTVSGAGNSKRQQVEQSMGDAAMSEPAVADSHMQSKLVMRTSDGMTYGVLQMGGYLLCEPCNARATDRVTMMCHLQGGKHISKIKSLHHDEAATGTKQEAVVPMATSISSLEPVFTMELDGAMHAMLKKQGQLFCNRCNVRADSEYIMRAHLRGKKHKSKTKASTTVAVGAHTVKEVAMAQTGAIAMSKKKTNFATVADKGAQATAIACTDAPLSEDDVTTKTTMVEQKEVVALSALTQAKATNVASTGDTDTSANEAAKTGDDVAGKMVKFMIEGIVYVVVEEANGALFCVPCGARRCDTYGMVLHLYTEMHRRAYKRYRGNVGNGMS